MLSVDPPSQKVIENSILALHEVLDNHRKVIMARQAALRPEDKVFRQQFGILDFVLVAKTRKRVHKLESFWTGPAQVISTINPWVYGISYLSSSRIFNVHVSRLRKYDNTLRLSRATIETVTKRSLRYFQVDKVLEWRLNETTGMQEGRVQWIGLEGDTWMDKSDIQELIN
jgi:hypothetical protein